MSTFSIHPRIGIARVGNSTMSFYLGPEKTGGRPTECDAAGNEVLVDGVGKPVTQYKDPAGGIKRQAARFKVFEHGDDGLAREAAIGDCGIAAISWTVHLANKKPIWYVFSELTGDLE